MHELLSEQTFQLWRCMLACKVPYPPRCYLQTAVMLEADNLLGMYADEEIHTLEFLAKLRDRGVSLSERVPVEILISANLHQFFLQMGVTSPSRTRIRE